VGTYSKHHLVPIAETLYAKAGPFAPKTFALGGLTFGIVICYEGVYPEISGDWSQFDSLKAQGTSWPRAGREHLLFLCQPFGAVGPARNLANSLFTSC
jgi:predicted amidohydrolase